MLQVEKGAVVAVIEVHGGAPFGEKAADVRFRHRRNQIATHVPQARFSVDVVDQNVVEMVPYVENGVGMDPVDQRFRRELFHGGGRHMRAR